jgi:hypothetical protein
MRLFATGAMQWVMGRALPDDVPIDSKMVSKAIERAQNTVEARNAEIRKDVLKYDEVMNEQRKVIYARRARSSRARTSGPGPSRCLSSAIDSIVTANCAGSTTSRTGISRPAHRDPPVLPDQTTKESSPSRRRQQRHLRDPGRRGHRLLRASRGDDATEWGTEETMRALEREVMLQLIDQKWREHLSEMDYLREGIGLAGHGPAGPAGGLAARRLRDVRAADVEHRRRLRQDRDARPGPGARAGPARRRGRPGRGSVPGPGRPGAGSPGMQRALAAGPAPGEEVVFATPGPRAECPRSRWRRKGARRAGSRRRPTPSTPASIPVSRTPPSTGPGATTRARAGAARSSSSATGARTRQRA